MLKLIQSFRRENLVWLGLSVLAILLDQWTKHIASTHLTYGEAQPVFPSLDWTLLHNHGAAFSFLSDAGGWQRYLFTGLAIIVSVLFIGWLLRLPRDTKVLATGIALVLGGAIGNLIDRMSLGYVVDFISVYYNGHYFPSFNLADSAITLGTIFLIIDMLFLDKIRQSKKDQASNDSK
ncbi:signal peptidase II [Aquirhabdus sp.]|uniref:signal peptidase II n=1 Tax=Aquirhabdus sp. TaxID=2824160 RepID=UPI00396C89F8